MISSEIQLSMYLQNGILEGRCACFTATTTTPTKNKHCLKISLVEQGWGRRRGDRRADGFIGGLRRVFYAMGRLGLSLFGLERRDFELRRQRRTMPTDGELPAERELWKGLGVHLGVVGGRT